MSPSPICKKEKPSRAQPEWTQRVGLRQCSIIRYTVKRVPGVSVLEHLQLKRLFVLFILWVSWEISRAGQEASQSV